MVEVESRDVRVVELEDHGEAVDVGEDQRSKVMLSARGPLEIGMSKAPARGTHAIGEARDGLRLLSPSCFNLVRMAAA